MLILAVAATYMQVISEALKMKQHKKPSGIPASNSYKINLNFQIMAVQHFFYL